MAEDPVKICEWDKKELFEFLVEDCVDDMSRDDDLQHGDHTFKTNIPGGCRTVHLLYLLWMKDHSGPELRMGCSRINVYCTGPVYRGSIALDAVL